jgi:hypothetical protein
MKAVGQPISRVDGRPRVSGRGTHYTHIFPSKAPPASKAP